MKHVIENKELGVRHTLDDGSKPKKGKKKSASGKRKDG